MAKKYYWLKLDRNFFKRHDIRIVEDMPNGKEYVLFFMKLLVESIDHEGSLRFNELIPYNDQMLSTITHTNIDIVRSAIKIFQSLELLEVLDDKTIYIRDTSKMLGNETEWAIKKRDYRTKNTENEDIEKTLIGHKKDIVRQEIEKELEIDKEKEKIRGTSTRFIPPTFDLVQSYISENQYSVDAQRFIDFYESKGWYVGKNKMKNWEAAIRTWAKDKQPKPSYKNKGRFEIETNYDTPQSTMTEQDEQSLRESLQNVN
jgi:predicted phage replisome organizer